MTVPPLTIPNTIGTQAASPSITPASLFDANYSAIANIVNQLVTAVNALGTGATYVEGSWTPVIAGSGTAGVQTYLTQLGRYIQVGNLVWIMCNVQTSAIGGTIAGNVTITGLPFTSTTGTNLNQGISGIAGSVTYTGGATQIAPLIQPNTTVITIDQQGTGVNLTNLPVSALGATSQFILSGSYRIN